MALSHRLLKCSLEQLVIPHVPQARCPGQCNRKASHLSHGRRKIAANAKVKAATIESPAKTSIDNKPKPTSTGSSSEKITPEEAVDLYRDMKLGRDFEEMYAVDLTVNQFASSFAVVWAQAMRAS